MLRVADAKRFLALFHFVVGLRVEVVELRFRLKLWLCRQIVVIVLRDWVGWNLLRLILVGFFLFSFLCDFCLGVVMLNSR